MKNRKKIFALFLSTTLVVSLFSGCASTTAADSDEIITIQNTLDEWDAVSELVNHSNTSGKEETVYALLSADGDMEQILVSEWLKNPNGTTTLTDQTDLSNITVVKGDAQYSKKDSDNQIVWTNNGSDIYYQGNSDKELPVDVHISYELDGKKVTADELSGASGHLKITFTYTNKLSKEIKIHDEKQTIYQPFVMISGMILDNSKAQNIIIDHGNIVNNGDDTIVLGLAMPGLKESLGLDDITDDDGKFIDFNIPEKVTVEADVSDFSLMMTLTIASNTALSQLGLDDIDALDDLKADLDKLTNGMNDIIDGSSQLNDGATKLKENSPSLISGVNSLTKGADQLSSGLDTIIENNTNLNTGASQITDGLSALNDTLNNENSKQQLQALLSGSSTFLQGLTQASDGLSKIVAGYNYNNDNLAALIAGLTQYAQELTASGDPTNITYAGYIQTILETYKELYNNVATAESGVNNLSASYNAIDSGIQTTANNISAISQAVGKLSSGAGQLKEGITSYTDGVSQTSNAVKMLDKGLNSLNAQIPIFANGIIELTNGTGTLKDGVIKFNDEGIQKLANIINNDLDTYYDRLKATQDFAKEYTSYAGCADNMDCSVKFIYKTDSIE